MAGYLGSWDIDDTITFYATTHNPTDGDVSDADSEPTYRVYEDESGTALLTGTMSKLDDANTVGFYSEQISLTAANGFEPGKQYVIRMLATVGSVTGTTEKTFQIRSKVNTVAAGGTDWDSGAITADSLASDAAQEIRNAITGGSYALDTDANGRIRLVVGTAAGEVSLTSGAVTVGTNNDKTGYSLSSAEDVYHADIQITVDDENNQDEYTVVWFLNGARVTSGITSPTIQVIKRSDGTDLVAPTAMSEIGSTETFKYDESTNRIDKGDAYIVLVAATIDESSREFARIVTRDSLS